MQSMTGFARVEKTVEGTHYTIEIKSVNHRYLDLRFRLPSAWQVHESTFAEWVRSHLQRGSVDFSLRQKIAPEAKALEGTTRFIVDDRAAQSLSEALSQLNKAYKIPLPPSADLLLATGKVILAVEEAAETKPAVGFLQELCNDALRLLVQERKREGQQTRQTLEQITAGLRALFQEIRALAKGHPETIRQKLTKRVGQWNLSAPIDATRLETEIAFFADRADIEEEIQRFEAHLEEFSKLLALSQPIGRKLDFLTQELHRETNTIASKAGDLGISRLAVEAKTAIEKLREQVQNVE
jgi:uncharacterized protein (TIGR00255 family)